MTMPILITLMMTMKNMNPMSITISILVSSLMMSKMIQKEMFSSWLPMVLIITFSSGMMTLFMYTASITSNEKTKMSKNCILMTMIMTMMMTSQTNNQNTNMTMKSFSSQTFLMILMAMLIITMLSMMNHGHHPHQTLNSSF